MLHAVILAGGGGTRLWPLSTAKRPKQYLQLVGDKSILELTVDRVAPFISPERIWVVTTQDQASQVRDLALSLPDSNIILEPEGRNTAPCIGLAAVRLAAKDPDATMLVLPADHLIRDEDAFRRCVETAIRHTDQEGGLITFGIIPTRPETGYGYIHAGAESVATKTSPVIAFKEKPDSATAVSFLKSGDYFWNSGMFVWKAATILQEFEQHLPDHAAILKTIAATQAEGEEFRKLYGAMGSISIDYGILEYSEQVMMVRGDFDWSDIGGFEELQRISEKDENGNHVEGKVLVEGVTDSYIRSTDSRPVAVIGLEGVTVVVNNEGILISRTSESQKVRLVAGWSNPPSK